MEDKTFELLEKMYSEFKTELNELKSGQIKLEVILEHDIKDNLKILHEGVAGNTAKLDDHTQRLDTIENKLDYLALSVNSQDKRLEVVESFKQKKAK